MRLTQRSQTLLPPPAWGSEPSGFRCYGLPGSPDIEQITKLIHDFGNSDDQMGKLQQHHENFPHIRTHTKTLTADFYRLTFEVAH